jgi:coenzyme F420-dependent glucose-6-phosphate dehydrogenase
MPNKQTQFGYKLSSEEFSGSELVQLAMKAEEHSFEFALISDHYHPWLDVQGQSPFVWAVLGGIAEKTSRLRVGTAVTCPTTRIHPAIIAQAAATVSSMMPERFFLGVGTGEHLNEHILGQRWPQTAVRQERLAEAIEVIRLLWRGGLQSFHGEHYTVENAQIYSLPSKLPPIFVAVGGPKGADIAFKHADGMIGTEPEKEIVDRFRRGSRGAPAYCEITVCYDTSENAARETLKKVWSIAALPWPLIVELPLPSNFEAAAEIAKDRAFDEVPCGPDPHLYVKAVQKYTDAGYDHVCLHQVGGQQQEFMDFWVDEVFPKLASVPRKRKAA